MTTRRAALRRHLQLHSVGPGVLAHGSSVHSLSDAAPEMYRLLQTLRATNVYVNGFLMELEHKLDATRH